MFLCDAAILGTADYIFPVIYSYFTIVINYQSSKISKVKKQKYRISKIEFFTKIINSFKSFCRMFCCGFLPGFWIRVWYYIHENSINISATKPVISYLAQSSVKPLQRGSQLISENIFSFEWVTTEQDKFNSWFWRSGAHITNKRF